MVFNSFVAVTCAALVAAPVVVGAQREGFQGRLSPLPVDARTAATITGEGVVSAELNGTELTIRVYPGFPTPFWGLSAFCVGDLRGKSLWKLVENTQRFPRLGGRVLCVHGAVCAGHA